MYVQGLVSLQKNLQMAFPSILILELFGLLNSCYPLALIACFVISLEASVCDAKKQTVYLVFRISFFLTAVGQRQMLFSTPKISLQPHK